MSKTDQILLNNPLPKRSDSDSLLYLLCCNSFVYVVVVVILQETQWNKHFGDCIETLCH